MSSSGIGRLRAMNPPLERSTAVVNVTLAPD